MQLPALRTLGNIVTGNDAQTQAVLDAGILPHLLSLMHHTRPGIVRVSMEASKHTQQKYSLIPPLSLLINSVMLFFTAHAELELDSTGLHGSANLAHLYLYGCLVHARLVWMDSKDACGGSSWVGARVSFYFS